MADVTNKFLIPREGLIVRDPSSGTPLAKDGEWKTRTGPAGRYWRRRVDCGDAIIVEKEASSSSVVDEQPTFYRGKK
jgi:hypothetical protein